MNAEEDYGFDVAGFLHLRQVLTPTEVAACNRALDAADGQNGDAELSGELRVLEEHPVLQRYLESLCGAGFIMDRRPSILDPAEQESPAVRLMAGDPERKRRLRYSSSGGLRVCYGLRVIWALAPTGDDGSVVLVSASHKRSMEPPADLFRGEYDLATVEPVLQVGDLLLCAATTLYGVRGRPKRLVEIEYVSTNSMPTAGFAEVTPPEWTTQLTPEQMAVIGPRTTGRGGTIHSNGEQIRLDQAAERYPSPDYDLFDEMAPDPKELWFWDVNGYLVLRGVLDEEWLAAAHRSIDAMMATQSSLPSGHPSALEEVPEAILRENGWQWPEETSERIRGDVHRPRLGGLYELPEPQCDPFRKMIAHPPIVQRLNWMFGYGFKELNEPMCCVYPKGTTGGSVHGQNPGNCSMINGRSHVDNLNVLWALHDEAPGFGNNSGGFICIPGSHKAAYPIPRPSTTSIDLPQVYKPPLQAGDVLFFGGVAHGTTAWRSDWERRAVIQFMCAKHVSIRPSNDVVGWRWSKDMNNPTNTLVAKR